MLIGYARVSTLDQDLSIQRGALLAAGVHPDHLYEEKASGKQADRSARAACLKALRAGDTLLVTRLDRLARDTFHLCHLAKQVDTKGAHIKALEQAFDTTTATGRLLFGMLAVVAQFETELRAERQREGIAAAQAKGVHFGRQKALTTDDVGHLRALRKEGWT